MSKQHHILGSEHAINMRNMYMSKSVMILGVVLMIAAFAILGHDA
jgi:hypothetical protein